MSALFPTPAVFSFWPQYVTYAKTTRGSLTSLLRHVADKYDVRPRDMLRRSRKGPAVLARREFMALARESGRPSTQIAAFLGCDHTTVLEAARRFRGAPPKGRR